MLLETDKEIAIIYITGTLFVFLLVSAIIIYLLLHQKKVNEYKAKIKIDEYNKKIEIIKSIQKGEEKERIRVSEELHDIVGTKLSAIKMNLDYINNCEIVEKTIISKAIKLTDETIFDVRNISHDLLININTLEELIFTIDKLINNLNLNSKCIFTIYYEKLNTEYSPNLLNNLYRIILEAINNIVKHSDAKNATIQIHETENILEVIISDDGIGFLFNNVHNGNGIKNIKNRTHSCNGNIVYDSSNKGTTIIINIPIS